jgi:2-polyprenyl-6-hydroxyphenyl methylase/3-demethylubiquinone-9 3-methyltransferase
MTSPGQLARRVLGPRLFPALGRAYRSIFVSLEKVAASLPELAPESELLEVGGGDGAMISAVLRRFPTLQATVIDLAPQVGGFLEPSLRTRVRVRPATSIADYRTTMERAPDTILVADVIHHVPPKNRARFFADLHELVGDHPTTIVVKDIEPGHPIAWLSEVADKYISGDRGVVAASRDEMTRLIRDAFGAVRVWETNLYRSNPPNYALVFECGRRPET